MSTLKRNPQIIVNGFVQAGIAGALDLASSELKSQEDTDHDTESDFGGSEEEEQNDYDVM